MLTKEVLHSLTLVNRVNCKSQSTTSLVGIRDVYIRGGPEKVSLVIVAITLSSHSSATHFNNFWHIKNYTL